VIHFQAIVFDLYGTLFDVHSIVTECNKLFPGRGAAISALWRQKQLEYTWLRSLMDSHQDFEAVTADALRFTAEHLGLDLDRRRSQALQDAYLVLAPFDDVPATLERLASTGIPLSILSNGSPRSIRSVVEHAGLAAHFTHLISVDEVAVFKPDVAVYRLGARRLGQPPASILFVSCNSWDICGAARSGYQTCWIDRNDIPFDQLGQQPDLVADNLAAFANLIAR
jgi:2-haloacid dehalogenase